MTLQSHSGYLWRKKKIPGQKYLDQITLRNLAVTHKLKTPINKAIHEIQYKEKFKIEKKKKN